jgi:Osmosensitive K+ channel histidine kinase
MIDAQMVDEFVEVKVIDQGKKISDHLQEIMFDVFAQARLKDARDQRGAGIGLAVCKSLIELHNGIIGSEHREGYNIFSFCLPSRSGLSMHTERDIRFITQKLSRLKSARTRTTEDATGDTIPTDDTIPTGDTIPPDDITPPDDYGTTDDSTDGAKVDNRPQFDTVSGTVDTEDDGLSGGTT